MFETMMQTHPQDFDEYFKAYDENMRKILGVKWTHIHITPDLWYNKDKPDEMKDLAKYFHVVGDKLLYARKYNKAYKYLLNASLLKKKLGQSRVGIFRSLAICCKLASLRPGSGGTKVGDWKWRANLYADAEIRDCIKAKNPPRHIREMQGEDMATEEYYLRSKKADNSIRYERLALMYLMKGDTAKCEEYLKHIYDGCFCLSCRFQECYDKLIVLGYMAEINGDKAKARECFEKAVKINPTDIENTMGLWANS
jgi:tetratricopeptide (TPR) repeat protein